MGEVAMQGNSIWGYEIHWKYPQYAYWNDGLNKTQANTIPLFFGGFMIRFHVWTRVMNYPSFLTFLFYVILVMSSPPHGKALLLGWIIYCVQ